MGIDQQEIDGNRHLRCHIGDGDGQQAARRDNRDQLTELRHQHGQALNLHRAPIQAAGAVERGRKIGRQGQEYSYRHDDEGRIEMRGRLKSKHGGRRQHLRDRQQQHGERSHEPEINSQHRGVKSRGSAIAIDAGFECKKTVDARNCRPASAIKMRFPAA